MLATSDIGFAPASVLRISGICWSCSRPVGAFLAPRELLLFIPVLENFSNISRQLAPRVDVPLLKSLEAPLKSFADILEPLSASIDNDGNITDNASSALREIRRAKRGAFIPYPQEDRRDRSRQSDRDFSPGRLHHATLGTLGDSCAHGLPRGWSGELCMMSHPRVKPHSWSRWRLFLFCQRTGKPERGGKGRGDSHPPSTFRLGFVRMPPRSAACFETLVIPGRAEQHCLFR